MKKCSKCGIEKPLTEFYKNKASKDGKTSRCKICIKSHVPSPAVLERRKERSRKWAKENRERKRQYDKERNADPAIRQKNIENNRKFYKENKEYYKKYREENKEKIKAKSKECYYKRCEKESACVYQILNTINGKVYIGETTRGELRWKRHLEHLRGNKHPNSPFQQDFNEHGEDAFEWSTIKELPKDKETLLLQEAIEIQERINNGEDLYNLILPIEQLKMLTENKEER